MQVAFTPATPAEARLLASFFQDYADLLETQLSQLPLPNVVPATPNAADLQAALEKPAAPKRARKSSATTAETPAASGSSETAAAVTTEEAAGNETSAQDATEPEKSSAAQAGNTEEKKDSPAASAATEQEVSVDDLRLMFGTLSQNGKRDEGIKIVRSYGANGIAEIPADKRAEVLAKFKGL